MRAMIMKYSRDFTWVALVLLTLIVLVNSYSIMKVSKNIDDVLVNEKEAAKPAEINVFLLGSSCKECLGLDKELAALKAGNVKVLEESSVSGSEASSLVSKYSIERLPAMVVTGEIEKVSLQFSRKSDDALVLETSSVPYVSAKTGSVKGLVKVTTIVEPTCKDCPDISLLVDGLERAGVAFSSEQKLEASDAKDLVAKYNITVLPALVLSNEISEYELAKSWVPQLGHIADDGSYLLDLQSPPYYDLSKKKLVGAVEMVGITDATCSVCYNLTEVHVPILQRFGVLLSSQRIIDVSSAEAKQLLGKYSITSVPTIVLSSEASEYKGLVSAWAPVGTVESDGSLVFRGNAQIGLGYKDLVSGKVIEPAQPQNPNA